MDSGVNKLDGREAMEKAFNIPLITEKILGFAYQFKDWKNIRLTSKFWRDATLEKWRKLATIKLSVCKKPGWISIKDFAEMMQGHSEELFCLAEKPFRRFILYPYKSHFFSSAIIPTANAQLFPFLEAYGPSMEYLRLRGSCAIFQCHFLEGMKWFLLKACPNLKHISLHLQNTKCLTGLVARGEHYKIFANLNAQTLAGALSILEVVDEQESSIFCCRKEYNRYSRSPEMIFTQVFNFAPNIKELRLKSKEDVGALAALSRPVGSETFLKIETLDLGHPGLGAHQQDFINLKKYVDVAKPAVKNLKIVMDLEWIRTEPYHFHRFFMNTSNESLTHLELQLKKPKFNRSLNVFWVSDLIGSYFPSLTEFTVKLNGQGNCKTVLFDFRILKGMPKLQVFRWLDSTHEGKRDKIKQKLLPVMLEAGGDLPWLNEEPLAYPELKHLREFWFHSATNLFNEASLRLVLSRMENLQTLAVTLDKKTFPVVFQMLPELEKLILLDKLGRSPQVLNGERVCHHSGFVKEEDNWKTAVGKKKSIPTVREHEGVLEPVEEEQIFSQLMFSRKLRIFKSDFSHGDVNNEEYIEYVL